MVSFSNTVGAHCDSVVDHYTLSSNSIQMDVKVPVQPSNFDDLHKGALMGALTFIEQDKNHTNQCDYKTKSIPSPGTTSSENPPLRRVFAFGLDEWRKNCLSAYLFNCTHPHCKILC
ncbi:hypothetical protein OLZ31_14510 [Enterobacter asburiae]|nr:hypothetical protein [Enterobacter asburiae]